MNEHVWRTFKAVSEYQSLTRAARHLNLSQAAVSQHIHRLESDYGTALFVRTSQGMMLTEVGELIYRDIVAMLKVLDDSRQRVQQHYQSSASSLTVGASFTIAEYMLPEMLAKIDHPQDRQNIVVRMANSHDVLDQVVHGDVDLGLVEAPLTHPDGRGGPQAPSLGGARGNWPGRTGPSPAYHSGTGIRNPNGFGRGASPVWHLAKPA
jgi:DNA-binding transcriptional LysR family regulator